MDTDKRAEFNAALKEAMKKKDQVTLSTVRLILAALKDRDIAARTQGKADAISDAEIMNMLQGMLKQRRESAATYKDAGRTDLAAREEAEMTVIEGFMPRQLDKAELADVIERLISETGAADVKDMGKVMGALKNAYAGRADMARAGALAREKLSA